MFAEIEKPSTATILNKKGISSRRNQAPILFIRFNLQSTRLVRNILKILIIVIHQCIVQKYVFSQLLDIFEFENIHILMERNSID